MGFHRIPPLVVVFLGVGCHGSRWPGGDVVNLDLGGSDAVQPEADPGSVPDSGPPEVLPDVTVDAVEPDEGLSDPGTVDLMLDPGPTDPGAEPGPDPGAPDVPPADPGTTPDPGNPDAPPPEDPIFRASEIAVVQPDFCLQSGGGGCTVTTAMVNTYLASAIADPANPLNLLLRLVPFEVGNPETDLWMGAGPCQFVGATPIACAFAPQDAPAMFEGPLFVPDGCGPPGHPVPCFQTAPAKVEIWFMGVFLAMHEARVSGWIESGIGGLWITHGVLAGFVPVNTTKAFTISLPGHGTITLYDLVKHNPVLDVAGVKAFRFEFHYLAEALAYLD